MRKATDKSFYLASKHDQDLRDAYLLGVSLEDYVKSKQQKNEKKKVIVTVKAVKKAYNNALQWF